MTVFGKRFVFVIILILTAALLLHTFPLAAGNGVDTPSGISGGSASEIAASARLYGKNAGEARLMTFNLLAGLKGFGGSPVESRAPLFGKLLNTCCPDAAALQEMCPGWYSYIINSLPGYGIINRPQTALTGRMTALIYNRNTLTPLECGDAEFEDADDIRTRRAVWAVFEIKATGERFAVFSTHLSLYGKTARNGERLCFSQTAQLIALVKKTAAENNCPVFILGDFNTKEKNSNQSVRKENTVFSILKSVFTDTASAAKLVAAGSEKSVFSGSNDHIFLYGSAQIKQYHLLSYKTLTELSDHYPICADVCIG